MRRLIILGSVAYLTIGFGHVVAGTVMESMVQSYGIQYADGGQLVMNQFLGLVAGMLLMPWLVGRFGYRRPLLCAFALLALAEASYALKPPWAAMLAVAPAAGIGLGLIEALVGAFVITAAKEKANVAMSRIEVFFSIGALLIPLVGAVLISAGIWQAGFAVNAILALATFAVWSRFWPKEAQDQAAASAVSAGDAEEKTGRVPGFWPIILSGCLFFFIYVGMEMSFTHYFPSLLVQQNGLSESAAALSLTVFWGAMTIGRLAAGPAADRWGGGAYLLAMCGLCLAAFAVMLVLNGAAALFGLSFAVGLAMSGMYSIALVFVNRALPGLTERTTSALMACGSMGGALLPKLTGIVFDASGSGSSKWLFMAMALLLLACIVFTVLADRRFKRDRVQRRAA
jgi:FHS family glucose/mannose:H+ symporter-like MFS transporter